MRRLLPLVAVLFFILSISAQNKVEKWRIHEIVLNGDSKGNPFTDVQLSAKFVNGDNIKIVSGFYDGNGIYKIRFMPQETGKWTYITSSNLKSLHNKKGKFECLTNTINNHGPVVVKDTFNFAYSDGKSYYPFGTTCYAWVHQGDSLAELTLKTLSNGYFNKIRMCIFPKDYDWNKKEPLLYPFEGKPLTNWDYTKFNPAYFQNIEKRIAQLDSLGIEADLIVFHPYDRWGFKKMNRVTDDLYINYIIARFSAYKNVWWSMANEYDFMNEKKIDDWNHFIQLFAEKDPYNHLRSIHNGSVIYDHTNPLLTHASIQGEETFKAKELRNKFKKPIVYDECRYEGNITWSWGNLTAEEMVNKFWRGVTNGGYVGHGETYNMENPIKYGNESDAEMWWSKGGILRGQSQERIKFLKKIIESAPGYLTPVVNYEWWMPYSAVAYKDEYFLNYYNLDQPRSQIVILPENSKFKAEIINGWDMTITPVVGEFSGKSLIQLPQKPFTAIRFTKIKRSSAQAASTGIEIVSQLEKPKNNQKFKEKDLAGYLLVYFKDQDQSAYMAISSDGYTFTDINGGNPVFIGSQLAEQKGVRDPHITRGPDGAFYLAMTDLHVFGKRAGFRDTEFERPAEKYGWGNNRALVLMKSYDLIHWTHSNLRVDKAFPELGDIDCSWAPETVYDPAVGKMMVYFTIRYNNKECNMYYAYTDDNFTKLETSPKRITEIGGLDGDITKVGNQYQLFYVSDAKILHSVSDKINEGYKVGTTRIDPEKVSTEAPNLFKRLGTNSYVLMYDVYGARPSNMGFSETEDFITYKNLGHFNEGVMKTTNFKSPKHGAVTYLTKKELKVIAEHWKMDIK